MFGIVLKTTNSSFQKGMTFCLSTYIRKVIKLLAFIFEHPSYCLHQLLLILTALLSLPDKHCLSHGKYLYQFMMTLLFFE